jgi:hypothetical protein
MLTLSRALFTRRRIMSRVVIALVWAALPFALAPTAEAQPSPDTNAAEEAKQQRLEFMRKEFETYSLTIPGPGNRPITHSAEPLLRYSNPVRTAFSDAAVFLWVHEGRPLAVAAISIRRNGNVGREFSSLSSEPLECRGAASERWTPKSAGVTEQDIPDAPAPKTSDKLRLVQMGQLARRFSVVMKEPETNERSELRLMSRPIYRFAADKAGIVDGALFAFAEGTDPEALLLLQAVRGAGDSLVWRYTLARMTSRPLEANLDERRVWSAEGYWANPRTQSDPYVELIRGAYPLTP